MKIWELNSGIKTVLSNEEFDLVQKIAEDADRVLTPRETIVAQKLVSKSVFTKTESENGHENFQLNYRVDAWRD